MFDYMYFLCMFADVSVNCGPILKFFFGLKKYNLEVVLL